MGKLQDDIQHIRKDLEHVHDDIENLAVVPSKAREQSVVVLRVAVPERSLLFLSCVFYTWPPFVLRCFGCRYSLCSILQGRKSEIGVVMHVRTIVAGKTFGEDGGKTAQQIQ
jgi:hypothetical protein